MGLDSVEFVGCVDNMLHGADRMTSAYAVDPGNFGTTAYEKTGCQGQRCSLSDAVVRASP
jgi:hypothetical protein